MRKRDLISLQKKSSDELGAGVVLIKGARTRAQEEKRADMKEASLEISEGLVKGEVLPESCHKGGP